LIGANTIYPGQQRQWFSDVSVRFAKENNGATVKFETFASANDEQNPIQTAVFSRQGPDLYALGTTFTPTAYATGAFVTLTADDWSKIGGRDKFVPADLGISGPDAQHLRGSLALALIIGFLHAVNNFTLPFVLFGVPAPHDVEVLPVLTWVERFQNLRFGLSAAMAVISLVLVAVPMAIYLRAVRLNTEAQR
jgi:hypothetical protein